MAKTGRFLALTTDDLRSMCESAWNSASEKSTGFFDQLQQNERCAIDASSNGVASQSNNSHSASAFFPGENRPSDAEVARGWRQLIDLYRKTRLFLLTCARNGFDAFSVTNQCQWPTFIAAQRNPAVIVDPNGNWQTVCDKYMVAENIVIGQPLDNENAIWLWMMESLQPVYESRADRTGMILAQGGYVS